MHQIFLREVTNFVRGNWTSGFFKTQNRIPEWVNFCFLENPSIVFVKRSVPKCHIWTSTRLDPCMLSSKRYSWLFLTKIQTIPWRFLRRRFYPTNSEDDSSEFWNLKSDLFCFTQVYWLLRKDGDTSKICQAEKST